MIKGRNATLLVDRVSESSMIMSLSLPDEELEESPSPPLDEDAESFPESESEVDVLPPIIETEGTVASSPILQRSDPMAIQIYPFSPHDVPHEFRTIQ